MDVSWSEGGKKEKFVTCPELCCTLASFSFIKAPLSIRDKACSRNCRNNKNFDQKGNIGEHLAQAARPAINTVSKGWGQKTKAEEKKEDLHSEFALFLARS